MARQSSGVFISPGARIAYNESWPVAPALLQVKQRMAEVATLDGCCVDRAEGCSDGVP